MDPAFEDLHAQLRLCLLTCAWVGEHPTAAEAAVLDELAPPLAALFSFYVLLLSRRPGWEGSETRADQPGYLFVEVKGRWLAVPWTLGADFPTRGSIEEIILIAHALGSEQGSTVCVSGSGAALSTYGHVGDLDYCEYLGAENPDGFLGKVHRERLRRDPRLECTAIAVFHDGKKPLPAAKKWYGRAALEDPGVAGAGRIGRGKLDYIAATTLVGTLEVTNMVIDLNCESASEVMESSFALQEAPLGATWIPRQLADPRAIGSYLRFLHASVVAGITSAAGGSDASVAKAAKRALSLARLLCLGPEAEALVQALRASKCLTWSALLSRGNLMDELSPDCARFGPSLQRTITDYAAHLGIRVDSRDWREVLSEARALAPPLDGVRAAIGAVVEKVPMGGRA